MRFLSFLPFFVVLTFLAQTMKAEIFSFKVVQELMAISL
jgi:hypothetical protein